MPTIDLEATTFEQTVTDHEMVLVDFWASWCGPCRQFAPVYEKASQEHPGIVFGKVDTEAQTELASAAQITSIPTLMAFKDGKLVFAQPGALPAPALEQVINALTELDTAQAGEAGETEDPGGQDGEQDGGGARHPSDG